jgi:hypothetical protein
LPPHPAPSRLAEEMLLRQAVELGLAPRAALGDFDGGAKGSGGGAGAAGAPHAGPGGGHASGSGNPSDPSEPCGSRAAAARVFSGIYAVGDNPAADVRGANTAGPPWVSVLVRTGVWGGEGGNNDIVDPAHVVVADVLAAVQAARHRARGARWHSMR